MKFFFNTYRYLVIVCNPGHVLSQSSEKDIEGATKCNPFIMVLDSLGM